MDDQYSTLLSITCVTLLVYWTQSCCGANVRTNITLNSKDSGLTFIMKNGARKTGFLKMNRESAGTVRRWKTLTSSIQRGSQIRVSYRLTGNQHPSGSKSRSLCTYVNPCWPVVDLHSSRPSLGHPEIVPYMFMSIVSYVVPNKHQAASRLRVRWPPLSRVFATGSHIKTRQDMCCPTQDAYVC